MTGMSTDALRDARFARELANETAEFWMWALQRGVEQRRELAGSAAFVDVSFSQLTRDPIAAARRVYAELGLALSPENEARMRAFVADWLASGQTGRHRHSLARFGLDARDLRERVGAFYDPAAFGAEWGV